MKYWNKDIKARANWHKVPVPINHLFGALIESKRWRPLKDTQAYKNLKFQLQQVPSSGRFYIDGENIYFELEQDLMWYVLTRG
jgi:hypothetical protein